MKEIQRERIRPGKRENKGMKERQRERIRLGKSERAREGTEGINKETKKDTERSCV